MCSYSSSSCDKVATKHCGSTPSCDSVAEATKGPCPYERPSLLEELAAKGVRLTPQRRALVEIIQSAEQHLDAATLLELAKKKEPDIDRATVYRTLELLKKHRLINELDLMHLQGEKHFYEVRTRRDHVHLACFQCGRIEEFSSDLFERLKGQISTQTGFEAVVVRLEVGGRCRVCRSKAAASHPSNE